MKKNSGFGAAIVTDIEAFQIGDLVKHISYDWGDLRRRCPGGERSNICFIIDIIESPDEKQVDLFPKVLIYDTRFRRSVVAHAYNLEFISRS
tara:strand:+ start:1647 stop:1922 length:276 start_codon:yes stop_codon:yes gene_type:complete